MKYGILGSEGCTEEMRQRIEENLGVTVTDNYGMTELTGPGVAGECQLRCGLHFAEDAFLPEIIDQDTLEQKAPGEAGELVVTTLTRQGMPVLRYRTKDITRLNYEPCACGRTHVRMEKVMGRTDDMLSLIHISCSKPGTIPCTPTKHPKRCLPTRSSLAEKWISF